MTAAGGTRWRVYLGLGSNVGDRTRKLTCARDHLEEAGIHILRASRIHETEPWGVTDQPKFLNQCLLCETDLAPDDLLRIVKDIERRCGRVPGAHWGPRVIDIDLLLIEGVELESAELRLPHQHLADREFVLAPLAEIAPELRLETGRTVREQLEYLRSAPRARPAAERSH